MSANFDPYYQWLAIPPDEQPASYYRLLGLNPFEANPDVIANAADRQMAHVRSFQNGGQAALSQRLLNELAAARIGLLNPENKSAYDRQLRAELAGRQALSGAAQPATARKAKPVAAAVKLPTARALDARPAGPSKAAAQPAQAESPLGFDPLSEPRQTPRRHAQPQTSTLPLVGAVAAGLLCIAGVAWWWVSGSSGPPPQVTVSGAPQSEKAVDATAARRLTAADEAAASPAADHASPAASAAPPPQPPNSRQGPSSADPAGEQPAVAETAGEQPAVAETAGDAPDDDVGAAEPEQTDEPPASRSTRWPVPDPATLEAATAEVRQLFRSELSAAKTPGERSRLAERLLALAGDSSEPAERYALLGEARRLTAASPALMLRAVAQTADVFDVDRWQESLAAVEELTARSLPSDASRELVEATRELLDEAQAAGEFETAQRMATAALGAARKAKLADAVKQLSGRQKELAAQARTAEEVAASRKKLVDEPDDAAAHLTLGKYLCWQQSEWHEGLPHLRQGSDPALSQAATLDQAGATAAAGRVRIGDAWWNAAETRQGAEQEHCRARAGYWYRQSVLELTGLSKAKVEKRLAELAPAAHELPNAGRGSEPPARASRGPAGSKPVTADKLVLWNMHNGHWGDRGTSGCNVELKRDGKIVWSQAGVKVAWSASEEPPTTIPIPRIPFDTLRVEITTWVQFGAGLCEIEVLRGRKNLALNKPVKASGERGQFKAATVVDGIKNSDNESSGFWWAPDHQPAWIEIELSDPGRAKAG